MPVFESFANFFANLSPRSQRSQRSQGRSAVQPGQPQTPPRYRPGRAPFTLEDDPPEASAAQSVGVTDHPEAVHSYVDNISSPTGPPSTSQRTPPQFQHLVIDLDDRSEMNPANQSTGTQLTTSPSRRTSQPSQMVNKNSRDRQDEARLLGGTIRDPNAVPIKPSATMPSKTKKPGSNYSFSPSDKISNKIRTSEPVRARAKPKEHASNMRRNPTLPDDAFEESSRPSKKRRQGILGPAIGSTTTTDVIEDRSHLGAWDSPQQGLQPKRKGSIGFSHRLNEYKEAEDGLSMSPTRRRTQIKQHAAAHIPDEQFTEKAAQQRRGVRKQNEYQVPKGNAKHKADDELQVIDRVEVKVKKSDQEKFAGSHQNRSLDSGRESPDAIQGDITTDPKKIITTKSTKVPRPLNTEMQSQTITRKRSPADIRPTEFSSPQGKKKIKHSHQKFANKSTLKASYLRVGSFSKQCRDEEFAPIHITDAGFELRADLLGDDQELKIPFNQIRAFYYSNGVTKKKATMILTGWKNNSSNLRMDLEFCNKKEQQAVTLIKHLLEPHGIFIDAKDDDEMSAKFHQYKKQHAHADDRNLMSLPSYGPNTVPEIPKGRLKLRDNLRQANGQVPEPKGSRLRKGSLDLGQNSRSIAKDRDHQTSDLNATVESELPVEPLGTVGRGTRSRTLREVPKAYSALNGSGPSTNHLNSALLEDDSFRENWNQPLVYPPNGKKKAEVTLDDRDRLREDTYLNDNLIAFYMRFLQENLERTNPDAAKRIYFFNSYFFATLRPPGTSLFNYKGVEKWTRSVDLFAYDYILVPINEHQHWYVAVICNLPSLSFGDAEPVEQAEQAQTPSSAEEAETPRPADVQKIDESPEPQAEPESDGFTGQRLEENNNQSPGPLKEQNTRKNLASIIMEQQRSANEGANIPAPEPQVGSGESDAEKKSNSTPHLSKEAAQQLAQDEAAASQSATRKKSRVSAAHKLNPNQPTIITFDSLDVSRSPTIKVLREYISAEAKGKRGVQIQTSGIKGMRGRGIPLQPNFSDCGLYLLAYLEKFIQSPDWFIAKVLQRGMDSDVDWPPLGSGLLRYRLRTFLDDLYTEQNLKGQSSKGPRMADRSPINYLLGPNVPHKEDTPADDMVPESQPEPRQENNTLSIPEKDLTPVDPGTQKASEARKEERARGQLQMASAETTPTSKTKNAASGKPQNKHSSLTKDQPVIQVPGSQEEPEIPTTPSPAEPQQNRRKHRDRFKN